jgi:hypothetical protein
MGGGSGARGDIGWVGHGLGPLGAYFARRRALRQIKAAVEADLTERGLPLPSSPLSRRKIFGLIFFGRITTRLSCLAHMVGMNVAHDMLQADRHPCEWLDNAAAV